MVKSPWWPLLPIEWRSAAWECALHVPGIWHAEPFLPPDPLQASQRLSFCFRWLELSQLLLTEKCMSLPTQKKNFSEGCRDVSCTSRPGKRLGFKGWHCRLSGSLSISFAAPHGCCWFLLLLFFSPLSLWNILLSGIHMANTQLNRQNKCERKGRRHDSQ